MLHKLSILALLGLAAVLSFVAPVYADRVPADLAGDLERDADSAPHYWHDVHVDVDKFSMFDREDADSDSIHPRDFYSGVPKTAEWIWWLNDWDKENKDWDKENKKSDNDPNDPLTPVPEPASLFLLGSGVLILGARRRRANHSVPIS